MGGFNSTNGSFACSRLEFECSAELAQKSFHHQAPISELDRTRLAYGTGARIGPTLDSSLLTSAAILSQCFDATRRPSNSA